MVLHPMKKLLHTQKNKYQSENTTHRMQENLPRYSLDKGLISSIYKELKN
jgi:hypothetical protein